MQQTACFLRSKVCEELMNGRSGKQSAGKKEAPENRLITQRWAMQPKAIATATTAELNWGMESSAYFASVAERVPNTAHQIRQSPACLRGKANAPTLAASVFGRHVNAVERLVG